MNFTGKNKWIFEVAELFFVLNKEQVIYIYIYNFIIQKYENIDYRICIDDEKQVIIGYRERRYRLLYWDSGPARRLQSRLQIGLQNSLHEVWPPKGRSEKSPWLWCYSITHHFVHPDVRESLLPISHRISLPMICVGLTTSLWSSASIQACKDKDDRGQCHCSNNCYSFNCTLLIA